MSFGAIKFLGATCKSFNTSIGWGESQRSQLMVDLVVDTHDGDSFSPPTLGTPVDFIFGSFEFYGLLQKIEKKQSQEGYPVYQAVIQDPRDILAGTVVITNNYAGAVPTDNTLNVFGFWEDTGFGVSKANESGMPWSLVISGILALVNGSDGPYGGPLKFQGISYGLDLSQLPTPPSHYRIGSGTSIELLPLIAQICEDGGYDFFVDIVGSTIRVRTVSRISSAPLGTISAVTASHLGTDLVRSNDGLEVRNETTAALLVGGSVTTLDLTNTGIYSFWGYDATGNPILGSPGRYDFMDPRYKAQVDGAINSSVTAIAFRNANRYQMDGTTLSAAGWGTIHDTFYIRIDSEIISVNFDTDTIVRGQLGTTAASHADGAAVSICWGTTTTEYVNLNSSEVADLLGSTTYQCTLIEMRLALIDFNSWSLFMYNYRNALATTLGLTNMFSTNIPANVLMLPPDLISDTALAARVMGAAFVASGAYINQHRFYEFVKNHAQAYMGKKFAVAVPVVLHSQDLETLVVSTNYEVTQGGYLPEGSSPLGISEDNQYTFQNENLTWKSFVRYDNPIGANLNAISPAERAVEPDGDMTTSSALYVNCSVDPNFIYTPSPAVVVTLHEGLFDLPTETVGSLTMVASVLMMNTTNTQTFIRNATFGRPMVKMFPGPRYPNAIAIPLKSNVLTYGPWYAEGVPGKVKFEYDPTMVPWEYGGYDVLDLVGAAKVSNAITSMVITEAGTLELAGMPAYSLGDVLQSGGPNITNITVSYGMNGVTTTYAFQTYTPRFGVFNKGLSEHLKKIGQTSQQLQKAMTLSLSNTAAATSDFGRAAAGARAIMLAAAPAAIAPHTPQDILVARNVYDPDASGIRPGVSTTTYEEAVAYMEVNDNLQFQTAAAMSLTGLVRPFVTRPDGAVLMSSFIPNAPASLPSGLNLDALNPWRAENDIEVFAWGSSSDSYEGLQASRWQPDTRRDTTDLTAAPVKALALRGPMIVTGWGFDWDGFPIPSTGDATYGSGTDLLYNAISGLDTVDNGYPTGYLVRSDWWATGPLDPVFDRRRGVWTVHDVVRGTLSDDLFGNASGDMNVCVVEGSPMYNISVYNWADQYVPVGTNVFGVFNPHSLTWNVIPAGGLTEINGLRGSQLLFGTNKQSSDFMLLDTIPLWDPIIASGDGYVSGDLVSYSGLTYQALDGGPNSPNGVTDTNWEIVLPFGAYDNTVIYNTGDLMFLGSGVYESTIDGNTSVPGFENLDWNCIRQLNALVFNLPDAGELGGSGSYTSKRGLVNNTYQAFWGEKTFYDRVIQQGIDFAGGFWTGPNAREQDGYYGVFAWDDGSTVPLGGTFIDNALVTSLAWDGYGGNFGSGNQEYDNYLSFELPVFDASGNTSGGLIINSAWASQTPTSGHQGWSQNPAYAIFRFDFNSYTNILSIGQYGNDAAGNLFVGGINCAIGGPFILNSAGGTGASSASASGIAVVTAGTWNWRSLDPSDLGLSVGASGYALISYGDGTMDWQPVPSGSSSSPHNLLDGSIDQDTTVASVVAGDLIYGNSSPLWDRLPIGSNGQILAVSSGVPSWQPASLATITTPDANVQTAPFNFVCPNSVALTGDGTSTVTVELVNDGAPSPLQYYGTNSGGVLGYYNLLSGSTIVAGDTGTATGTTITFTGGTCGLTFGASSSTVTLSGTLVASAGGTGGNSSSATGFAYVTSGAWAWRNITTTDLGSTATTGYVLTLTGTGTMDWQPLSVGSQQTLTDGATISWDVTSIFSAVVTLGGNRTLSNPTGLQAGGTYTLIVNQDSSGSRTLSFGSVYKWPGGVAPTLSTAANAVDIFTFLSDGTNMYGTGQQLNFS